MSAVLESTLELVEYLRVSVDESGRERSNDEQHVDNAKGASRAGWNLSTEVAYSDVGSASRFARKVRGGFGELVADLRSGRFTADGLILWESSRGSRKVSEWCELLELLDELGKVVVVTTHGPRLYDPSNDRDWRTLIEDAVDAEYESRKTSKRVGRSMASSAAAGQVPGGRRAFGYTADGMELHPTEAPIVRECVRRVLASESIRSIAADLNRRGIRTPGTKANPLGNAWHPGPLRQMLAGPRIAALRTHKGRIVAPGVWPAIIDETTHRLLVTMLAVSPRTGERGRSPWMLTGLLRCERCGANLVGNTDVGGTRRYVCRKAPGYSGCGGLTVKAEPVEEVLGGLLSVRLADAEARRNADATDADEELDELNRIEVERVEIAESGMSVAARAVEHAALDRRKAAVEERLSAKVHRTNAALALVAVEEFAGRPFADLEVDEARTFLAALIDHVTVGPSTVRGSTRFERERVTAPGRIVWRDL